MNNKIDINWPTYIAKFSNPNHIEIKNDLINFFEDYIKKIQMVESQVRT